MRYLITIVCFFIGSIIYCLFSDAEVKDQIVIAVILSIGYTFGYFRDEEDIKCSDYKHNWKPAYIKGTYNNEEVLFIACECQKCRKGSEGLAKIHDLAINRKIGTWSEDLYDREFKKEQ